METPTDIRPVKPPAAFRTSDGISVSWFRAWRARS